VRARHAARQAARVQRNAELCGVPLPEWKAMTRAERRQLLRAAKYGRRATAPYPSGGEPR
jgi:hypothetical protein